MVTFISPHFGYTRGELTGRKVFYQYEVRLSSGYYLYLYEDEFTRD